MATMTMDFGGSRIARPAVRTSSSYATPAVRLTARGRLVVRVLIASVVTLLAFTLLSVGKGVVVAAMVDSAATTASHSVVVRAGDTLWQISARELPGVDPREGIARIRTLNGLSATDTLLAGETVEIPTV